jgi:CRP-like cAMP-binding protein
MDLRKSATVELTLEQLRRLIPFDKMSRNSLRHLIDHAYTFRVRQGEVLFDIGETKPWTLYLIRGAVRLNNDNGSKIVVESGTDRGRYALANLLPRQYRARVVSKQAVIAAMDRDLLEKEVAWGQLSRTDGKGEKQADNDWKMTLLRTPTFSRLPMANVQKLFEVLQEHPAQAGDDIIREGDQPGDYYYIIRKGKCSVTRNVAGRRIKLGTLGEADSFGDEALVADRPRNATVTMETDGLLMRLPKTEFTELMHAPLVRRIDLKHALQAVNDGKALLIDVRTEKEFTANRLPQAINIPVFLLYLKSEKLRKSLKYIVYCDTGNRSEAAAFILTRRGFGSYVLNDPDRALEKQLPANIQS